MITEIKMVVREIDSFGDIARIFDNEIVIQPGENSIDIFPTLKDPNDERSVYIILNKFQCQVLADILLRASMELKD